MIVSLYTTNSDIVVDGVAYFNPQTILSITCESGDTYSFDATTVVLAATVPLAGVYSTTSRSEPSWSHKGQSTVPATLGLLTCSSASSWFMPWPQR